MRVKTTLHMRLVEHRTVAHPGCRGCPEYLEIVKAATRARTIEEGRLNMAYSWLSVREAVDF